MITKNILANISKSRNGWEEPENRGVERAHARFTPLFSEILSIFVKC